MFTVTFQTATIVSYPHPTGRPVEYMDNIRRKDLGEFPSLRETILWDGMVGKIDLLP